MSLRANACPHCGAPVERLSADAESSHGEIKPAKKKGRTKWLVASVAVLAIAGIALQFLASDQGSQAISNADPDGKERSEPRGSNDDRPKASLNDLDAALKSSLAGQSCAWDERTHKQYPADGVGVSSNGVLTATVQDWNKGTMRLERTVSVPISDFSSTNRRNPNECHIVNLKCNRFFIDSEGHLSKCAGGRDSLDLYFPSKAAATRFEKMVEAFLSPQVVPKNSKFARIPDGRVVVQPPGTEGWVLKEGNALHNNAVVIESDEELVMSGSAESVEEMSEMLSNHADGVSCRFKTMFGTHSQKNKSRSAVTVDSHGVLARHYVQRESLVDSWDSVKAAVINNLDIAAATLEGDECLQLKVPCRKNFRQGFSHSECVVTKKRPESVLTSSALMIPMDTSATLGELKQALNSLSASFAPPAKSSRDDGEPARPNTSTNQDFIERGKKVAEQHIAKLERQQKELIRKMQNSFNQECHVKWTNCWKTEDGVWMYQTSDKKHWYWEDGSLVQKDNWPYGPNYSAIRSDDSG